MALPLYPNFKPLELDDRAEVEALTKRFPPYSDFNFTNLWSWDVRGSAQLSRLGTSLIVRLYDLHSGAAYYSLLGDEDVDDLATRLIHRASREEIPTELRVVPECVRAASRDRDLEWDEDDTCWDYVLSTVRIQGMEGGSFRRHRQKVRWLFDSHPVEFERMDLRNRTVHAALLGMFELWARQRGRGNPRDDAEYQAFTRLLRAAPQLPKLLTLGAFVQSELAGFIISEPLTNGYAHSHFWKADTERFEGVYPALMRECSRQLATLGCTRMNIEEDLGLPGLRQAKGSFVPAEYLKKFTVRHRDFMVAAPCRTSQLPPPIPDPALSSYPVPQERPRLATPATGYRLPPPPALPRIPVEVPPVAVTEVPRRSTILPPPMAASGSGHSDVGVLRAGRARLGTGRNSAVSGPVSGVHIAAMTADEDHPSRPAPQRSKA